jgi:hypothetical protein
MNIINKTPFQKAEKFIIKKLSSYNTDRLTIKMNYGDFKRKTQGHCSYPVKRVEKPKGRSKGWYIDYKKGEWKISTTVSKTKDEDQIRMAVSTRQLGNGFFEWLYDTETEVTDEEQMVWLLGHEIWHFLCKSKQEKGNWETRSNANGFKWLREFKNSPQLR